MYGQRGRAQRGSDYLFASGGRCSESDVSWADVSWADVSWTDSSYEDAAEGDAAGDATDYKLTPDQAAQIMADPDSAPDPENLPAGVAG